MRQLQLHRNEKSERIRRQLGLTKFGKDVFGKLNFSHFRNCINVSWYMNIYTCV